MSEIEQKQPLESLSNEEKVKELTEYMSNLEFYSNTIRYRSIIYQGINLLIEKIDNMTKRLDLIEEKLKSKEY